MIRKLIMRRFLLLETKLRNTHQRISLSSAGRIRRFKKAHMFEPDLESPKRFSEKLLRRILLDRDPYYILYANKLLAPEFISQRRIEGLQLPTRYRVATKLTPEDFDELPKSFVIKSAYGSGLNEIIKDKSQCDQEEICFRFNAKMPTKMNAQGFNYAYNCAIFEEYLGDCSGKLPDDFKFHCFRKTDGNYETILQIDSDRFGAHRQSFFDEDFQNLPLRFGWAEPHDICPQPPDKLDHMTQIAKQLAAGFDYVRVDLYIVRGVIYFGEITPFHRGGMARITPDEWDHKLGEMWQQTTPYYTPTSAAELLPGNRTLT